MPEEQWITVPNWPRFQHYGLYRRPPWIKNYTSLLSKDEYLDLPLAARGLLHGIWLAYADRDGRVRTSDIRALLQTRGRLDTDLKHLASLSDAGLIVLVASRPLSLNKEEKVALERTRQRTRQVVEETEREQIGVENLERPTDLRAVHNRKRERVHDQLLDAARRFTDDWKGTDSQAFDAGLDELEHLTGSRLQAGDRYRLWEHAYRHQ